MVYLIKVLIALSSFVGADPHLRKDLASVLARDSDAEPHDTLGRTLEANKDRILKLVRNVTQACY
jgi:hypothetical protein